MSLDVLRPFLAHTTPWCTHHSLLQMHPHLGSRDEQIHFGIGLPQSSHGALGLVQQWWDNIINFYILLRWSMIDEDWWSMMKYANIFRCCILPTVPRYIQEISKKIEHFFWEKSDSLAAISGELDTRTTHPIECACIIWSRLRCYFSCPPEGKLRGVQCLSLFACGIYKIMLTQIWYIILSYDIIIYNHL